MRRLSAVTEFPGQEKRSIFEPNRVVVEKLDGTVVEARDDPEKSFEGHVRDTPWDDIHTVFFSSEALWTYLTTPFLCTYQGFATEEITSIRGGRNLETPEGHLSGLRIVSYA
jgi:hypothetical protein